MGSITTRKKTDDEFPGGDSDYGDESDDSSDDSDEESKEEENKVEKETPEVRRNGADGAEIIISLFVGDGKGGK